MTLKLIWALYNLYRSLQQLRKEHFSTMGNLGWRTITGAILMGLGYACKALATVEPIFDTIGDALIAIGVTLGGIGLRAAIAKK